MGAIQSPVSAGGLPIVAQTPAAGFALQNGTPSILSWTAPDDGKMHQFGVISVTHVTSNETGGGVEALYTSFTGASNTHFTTLLSANLTTDTIGQGGTTLYGIVAPGTAVTLQQISALTGGAALVWATLLGS